MLHYKVAFYTRHFELYRTDVLYEMSVNCSSLPQDTIDARREVLVETAASCVFHSPPAWLVRFFAIFCNHHVLMCQKSHSPLDISNVPGSR